jgi:hypothetical protein
LLLARHLWHAARAEEIMQRHALAAATVLAALGVGIAGAQAFDDAKYPQWKGQWTRAPVPGVSGNPSYDPSKPRGRGEQAPLTAEYRALFEANLKDQAEGGQGNDATFTCLAPGMPRSMISYGPMEIVILPEVTYILIEYIHDTRRVFTDGRDWPAEPDPSFGGYSIGRWIDSDDSGRYRALDIETRYLKGPRAYDASGLPLHEDNQTIVKERIFLDPANPNLLHDEITTFDHALTRPWTVTQNYRKSPGPRPFWREYVCAENNSHIVIGNETYYLAADGLLMPAKKDQRPPDLRYFKRPQE